MEHFYFFSYGSNLLFDRIHERTPSVEVIQVYKLDNFEVHFNKLSRDVSTKANLVSSENACAYGVIHRIDRKEKAILDDIEGLGFGYDMEFFRHDINEQEVEVGYYIARDSKYLANGNPFDWYLDFVKFGAEENEFPIEYQRQFHSVKFDVDKNANRRRAADLLLQKYRITNKQ